MVFCKKRSWQYVQAIRARGSITYHPDVDEEFIAIFHSNEEEETVSERLELEEVGSYSGSLCSHDSMTYGITRSSTISPDAEEIIVKLAKHLRPFVKLIMFNWSVTQGKNVTNQLKLGVRYLDLRIALKASDHRNFYFVHGMYANKINGGLSDIVKFLNAHKKEIVILDFQHFYGLSYADHERLVKLITEIFKDKLCPEQSSVRSVTLNWMMENNYQVIAIYRAGFSRSSPLLWSSNLWPNPWPNTMNSSHLLQYLQDGLPTRNYNLGFVSQCVLTPQTSTVVMFPFNGVMSKCAKPVCKKIIPWIQEQSPPLNVAMADFVDMKNATLPMTVVSLNYC
ncbi:PI-PLC X domain-containing protein 3 isoform X2 [Rhodnius prolixus]|uniref:PI-PLC X domain-containing protein 3 isoform X2 n=1 Tax=Rhodnius prolixus TaxID=13249 RepID=UPI003D18F779